MDRLDEMDEVTYLEMARLAMAMVPDELMEEMDISEEEFLRLREELEKHMGKE